MKAEILKKVSHNFAVRVPYESKDLLKISCDSYKWDKKNKYWLVPATKESFIKLRDNFKELDFNESIRQYLWQLHEQEQKIEYIHKIRNDPEWRLNGKLSYLYSHQCVAFESARTFNSFAFFLDTGTGKTAVSIEIIKHYGLKTLVVCPLSIIEAAWLSDIQKFSSSQEGLKAISLWASSKSKRLEKLAANRHQVYIINFEGLKILEKELIGANFGLIIIDESSKMKDFKSQTSKCILRFANHIPKRYILSGSPAPNTPLEYWAQINFVDPTLFPDNFYRFRNLYFFQSDYMGYKYDITPENKRKLMDIIKRKAIFYSKDECLDLPEKIYQERIIEMSKPQAVAYKQMKIDLMIKIQDKTISVTNQIAKIMKLRQVTSGWIYHEVGPIKIADTKINELKDVLSEIGDKQVIIWIQFHFEGHALMDIFKEKACSLWGDLNHDQRERSISDFQTGKKQYLIANPATAAHGLTFVNCQYAIYFSLSYSAELWKQSQDRIHRIGQAKNVTYIYLLCNNSIDLKIYEILRSKKKLSEECLSWLN